MNALDLKSNDALKSIRGFESLTFRQSPDRNVGAFLDKKENAMDENKNINEKNIDEILEYPDFNKLEKSNFRNLFKGTISISKKHLIIYIVTLFVSLAFIVPYAFCNQGSWASIGMSIGASGIGAAILGLFIELAVKSEERKKYVFSYNNSILLIYHNLWEIFANRSYNYMNLITPPNAQQVAAQQSADKFITQISIVVTQINTFILNYSESIDDDTAKFYTTLKDQLIQFKASLQNPINTTNLIQLLDGVRIWLRNYFELSKIEKQLLIF